MRIDLTTVGGLVSAVLGSGIVPGGSAIAMLLAAAQAVIEAGDDADKKLAKLVDYYKGLPADYVPSAADMAKAVAEYSASADDLRDAINARLG